MSVEIAEQLSAQMAAIAASDIRRRTFLENVSNNMLDNWQTAYDAGMDDAQLTGMEQVLLRCGVGRGENPADTLRLAHMRARVGAMTYPERAALVMHTTWERRRNVEFLHFMLNGVENASR